MPTKGGEGVVPGSTVRRQDLYGEGTPEKPYHSLVAYQVAGGSAYQDIAILTQETDVCVRFRRITMDYIVGATGVTGPTVWWGAYIRFVDSSGALSQIFVQLADPKMITTSSNDNMTWDFGPSGLMLYKPSVQATTAQWDGILTLKTAGTDGTDRAYILIELEWWYA